MPEKIKERLSKLYIGGSSKDLTVKCMHAHLSTELSGFGTVAGKMTMDFLKETYPEEMDFIFTNEVSK